MTNERKTWITDKHGNRCSVECWGTEGRAREALDSLVGCSGCSDCSGCVDCVDCFRCSGCSGCFRCSDCSDCSGCSSCSRCFDCSGCPGCVDCSGCSGETKEEIELPETPVVTDLHCAVYAAASRPEALAMDTWHTCETIHCRAGWVVTLAGKEGKELESWYGTLLAAMKIYDASCPGYKINPCRFFDSNKDALEDMRKLACGAAKYA